MGIVARMDKEYSENDGEFKHEFQTLKEDIRNKVAEPTLG